MPDFTPLLNLTKPLILEAYDVEVPNGNMDKLDDYAESTNDRLDILEEINDDMSYKPFTGNLYEVYYNAHLLAKAAALNKPINNQEFFVDVMVNEETTDQRSLVAYQRDGKSVYINAFDGNTWTGWTPISNTVPTSTTDIKTIAKNSTLYCSSTTPNLPTVNNYFVDVVVRDENTNYRRLVARRVDLVEEYECSMNNGTWTSWFRTNSNHVFYNGNVEDFKFDGELYCPGTTSGIPFTSAWYITVRVNPTNDAYRRMKAIRVNSTEAYERHCENNAWGDWIRVDSNNDIGSNHYITATGTNALTASMTGVPLVTGTHITFKNTTANTGNVTFNFNSNGAKPVLNNEGGQLYSGRLKAGGMYQVVYDGTNFILLNESGVRINSVQRGTFNFNANSTTQTITISSVNMSKAVLKINVSSNATTAQTALVGGQLTSATQITLYKGTANTAACQVFWEVVEYDGDVNVQRGTANISAGNQEVNVTIGSVNLNNSMNFVTNTTSGGSTSEPAQKVSGRLSIATNLTIYRIADEGSANVYWQVVEIKS